MKRKLLSTLLLVLAATGISAQSSESDRLFAEAMELCDNGDYTQAIRMFSKVDSIDKADPDLSGYRKDYAQTWLAYCHYILGDSATAQQLSQYTYQHKPVDRRRTVKSDSLCMEGDKAWGEGNLELALSNLTACSDEEARQLGRRHLYRANTLQQIGFLCNELGRTADAISSLEQANSIYRSYGFWPGMVRSLPAVGRAYGETGQTDKYFQLLDEVLPLSIQIDTLSTHFNADLYLTLMDVCCNMADWTSVANLAPIAMNIYKNLGITDSTDYYYLVQRAIMGFYMADMSWTHDTAELLLELEKKFDADSLDIYNSLARCHKVKCEKGKVPIDVTIAQAEEVVRRIKAVVGETDEFYAVGLIMLYECYDSDMKAVQTLTEQMTALLSSDNVTLQTKVNLRQHIAIYRAFCGQIDTAIEMFEQNKRELQPYASSNIIAFRQMMGNAIAMSMSVTQNSAMDAVVNHLSELKDFYEHQAHISGMTDIYDEMYYRLLIQLANGYSQLGNKEQSYKVATLVADAYGKFHQSEFLYNQSLAFISMDNIQFGGETQLDEDSFYAHDKPWTSDEAGKLYSYLAQALVSQNKSLYLDVQDTLLSATAQFGTTSMPYLNTKLICLFMEASCVCESQEEFQKCYDELQSIEPYIERNVGKLSVQYRYFIGAHMVCNFRLDKQDETIPLAREYHDLMTNEIRENFLNMTYEERTAFWNNNNGWFLRDLPVLLRYVDDSEIASCAYDALMLAKGILLNSDIEVRKQVAQTNDTISIRLNQELGTLRQDMRQAMAQSTPDRTIVDSLRTAIRLKERELMAQNRSQGDYTQSFMLSWRDILDALDDNEAAIEFIYIPDTDNHVYGALLLSKEHPEPEFLYLCDASELNAINPNDYYTTAELYTKIWENIGIMVPEGTRIYFSPTEALHNIAIEYVPTTDGGTIADKYQLYRVSSTREILARRDAAPRQTHALLYGDLDYWGDEISHSKTQKLKSSKTPKTRGVAGCDGTIAPVEQLPYTKVEIDSIAQILADAGIPFKKRCGNEGDEASIKNLTLGDSIGILHIATHGLYKPEQQNELMTALDAMGLDAKRNASLMEDLQLMCSGLAMANANKALAGETLREGQEDGLLTALEISRIDMRNTDLCVLSACNTALGTLSSDGVFGLQRGFKKAGAKSLLMSLWPVDDEATQILMTQFYRNYVAGKSKQQSLAAAQAYLRKYENGKYDAPEFWAAFILLDALDK